MPEPIGCDAATAAALARWRAAGDAVLGRVAWVEAGVVGVLGPSGLMRASVGGALLARLSAKPASAPRLGDWVVVRRWPDHRLTVELVLQHDDRGGADVTPLDERRRRRRDSG